MKNIEYLYYAGIFVGGLTLGITASIHGQASGYITAMLITAICLTFVQEYNNSKGKKIFELRREIESLSQTKNLIQEVNDKLFSGMTDEFKTAMLAGCEMDTEIKESEKITTLTIKTKYPVKIIRDGSMISVYEARRKFINIPNKKI